MVILPPVLDMSIHAHLEVSVGAPGSVRQCREVALLGADDLAVAQLITRPSEGMKDTNFVLEVHPSKTCFAEVMLLIQYLEVLLRLHELCLLCFNMVSEVAVAHDLHGDHPVSNFLDFLTDNLEVGGSATKELEEPTGEWEDGVSGVIVQLCKQISNVGDRVRAVILEESGATPVWELLDPVGWLPETFLNGNEEARGLICIEDEILLRGNARGVLLAGCAGALSPAR